MDVFLDCLNPLIVFRNYVRIPVEAFVWKQYSDYKTRANKGVNSVKDLLFRVAIIWLFVTAILWISVFMYVVFYYTYMPNVTHVRPVHLQFKSCEEQTGICSFPSAHVQLTKRSHMLMAAQPYRIKLILDMPESQINKELGMFMVCAQMRAKGGVLVSSSCRSAMLRHRSASAFASADVSLLKSASASASADVKKSASATSLVATWNQATMLVILPTPREEPANYDGTDVNPADTTQVITEPKFESTPNTSGETNVQNGSQNHDQCESGVNCGRSYIEAPTYQRAPNPTLPPNTPNTSEFRSESVSQLAEAVLALATVNQSIADSLRALASRASK